MLIALFKKQFYELFALLFMGAAHSQTKKSKKKTATSITSKIFLFTFLYLIIFAGMCFMALPMTENIIGKGYDWIYFVLFGFIALVGNIAFNVFISYNMLFKPKDNDLLLSLPIPPKLILLSRMTTLSINCVLVNLIVWLPAVVMYQTAIFSPIALTTGILMCFAIAMISLAISCLLGWLVAIILKNKITKIFLSVIGSLLLIFIVVIVRAFINFVMSGIIQNINEINSFMTENASFLITFGQAACGDITSFMIILAISLILFIIVYIIMSKTFMFVVNSKSTAKRKVYKQTEQKSNKISKSLLNKEWSFFFKTPLYITNAGIGTILNILLLIGSCVGAVMIFQLGSEFTNLLNMLSNTPDFISKCIKASPVFYCAILMFTIGLNIFGASSVSVEGKTFWILKSCPIKYFDIVKAKIKMAVYYSVIIPIACIIIFCIAFRQSPQTILIAIICVVSYSLLTTYLNTLIGVLRANLVWKNIAQPVKQNLAVLFSMLINIAITGIFIAAFIFSLNLPQFSTVLFLSAISVIFIVFSLITRFALKPVVDKKFNLL